MPADPLLILDAEANDGFRDRKVIGGLAGFMRTFAAQHPTAQSAADLLRDYADLDKEERAERLAEARRLLSNGTPVSRPEALRREASTAGSRAERSGPLVAEGATQREPPPGLSLDTPIEALKGIGAVRARLYARLGLKTIGDLLLHFPSRHVNFPPPTPIGELFFQPEASVVGTLERLELENLPRGLKKLRATITDASGSVTATWLRYGVAHLGVRPGDSMALSGKLTRFGRQLTFENPDYERGDGPPVHTRGLVPIYPLTGGLSDRELRGRIYWAVVHFAAGVSDPLPAAVRQQHGLMPIEQALRAMHFPPDADAHAEARRRFAFQELLTIQLVMLQRRQTMQHDPAPRLPRQQAALDALRDGLPFELTRAQHRVTDEILRDLAQERPMTRLLQGEVGSGKTAVAALALVNAVANGYQGALMAPTEILAEQHFATLTRLYDVAGPGLDTALGRRPRVTLLTGSTRGKERTATYAAAADGSLDILVGTQALIQAGLDFARLGLVVVDEQHRFGVRQRVTLRRKAQDFGVPHLLVMTATPIPRTLALSLYGDLDLSAIDELPPGRRLPKTVVLGPAERDLAYERVRRAAARGRQSFIICPLIEESEALEARAATEEFERLRADELRNLRLGLLHGRMKATEKEGVMRAFRDAELDVLVSTAVIEVGVDVPNATVMLIEGAERFGLAQLHQFRGRIGRGQYADSAVCILLSDKDDSERLQIVARETNGLALAEHDLRLRGPGDYFGVRQSGFPELKVARLDDAPLVESARQAAQSLLSQDPDLSSDANAHLRAHLDAFLAHSADPS